MAKWRPKCPQGKTFNWIELFQVCFWICLPRVFLGAEGNNLAFVFSSFLVRCKKSHNSRSHYKRSMVEHISTYSTGHRSRPKKRLGNKVKKIFHDAFGAVKGGGRRLAVADFHVSLWHLAQAAYRKTAPIKREQNPATRGWRLKVKVSSVAHGATR